MAVYSLTEEGDRFQINFEFLEKKITLRSLDRGEQYRFLQKVLKLLRAYCTLSYHRAIDISSRSSAERIFSEELNLKTPVLNQDDVSTVFRRDGGRQRGRGKHYSGRGFSCQGAGYSPSGPKFFINMCMANSQFNYEISALDIFAGSALVRKFGPGNRLAIFHLLQPVRPTDPV